MAQKGSEAAAVIGLGSMGLGIAASLIRSGTAVSGFDPAEAALTRCVEAGGHAAANPREAARGELTVMVSGHADAFGRAAPLPDAMAVVVHQLGEETDRPRPQRGDAGKGNGRAR